MVTEKKSYNYVPAHAHARAKRCAILAGGPGARLRAPGGVQGQSPVGVQGENPPEALAF